MKTWRSPLRTATRGRVDERSQDGQLHRRAAAGKGDTEVTEGVGKTGGGQLMRRRRQQKSIGLRAIPTPLAVQEAK